MPTSVRPSTTKPDPATEPAKFPRLHVAIGLQQNLSKSPFLASNVDESRISLSFQGVTRGCRKTAIARVRKRTSASPNIKLEIPIAAAVSFPISITYSNATELIKEHDVRGSFGITFDLDKLRTLMAAR